MPSTKSLDRRLFIGPTPVNKIRKKVKNHARRQAGSSSLLVVLRRKGILSSAAYNILHWCAPARGIRIYPLFVIRKIQQMLVAIPTVSTPEKGSMPLFAAIFFGTPANSRRLSMERGRERESQGKSAGGGNKAVQTGQAANMCSIGAVSKYQSI